MKKSGGRKTGLTKKTGTGFSPSSLRWPKSGRALTKDQAAVTSAEAESLTMLLIASGNRKTAESLIKDPSLHEEVRLGAIHGFKEHGDPSVVPLLYKVLVEQQVAIDPVIWDIGQLVPKIKNTEYRRKVAEQLTRLMLEHPNKFFRLSMVETLKDIAEYSTLPLLFRIKESGEIDEMKKSQLWDIFETIAPKLSRAVRKNPEDMNLRALEDRLKNEFIKWANNWPVKEWTYKKIPVAVLMEMKAANPNIKGLDTLLSIGSLRRIRNISPIVRAMQELERTQRLPERFDHMDKARETAREGMDAMGEVQRLIRTELGKKTLNFRRQIYAMFFRAFPKWPNVFVLNFQSTIMERIPHEPELRGFFIEQSLNTFRRIRSDEKARVLLQVLDAEQTTEIRNQINSSLLELYRSMPRCPAKAELLRRLSNEAIRTGAARNLLGNISGRKRLE